MITIYHNPRCKKSREGLALLEASGKKYQVVKYLDNPISSTQLKSILQALDVKTIDLVRKNEKIWKEQFKGKELSQEELIKAMVEHPKLIERPIVTVGKHAVIGRPKENISQLLDL